MPMSQLCGPDMMLGTEAPPTDPSGPQAGCMAEQEQEESLHEPIPWLSCPDLVLGTCALILADLNQSVSQKGSQAEWICS